jgi:hypothetical protein
MVLSAIGATQINACHQALASPFKLPRALTGHSAVVVQFAKLIQPMRVVANVA